MPKEKSVGAIVFRGQGSERQFLLLHYIAGHWGLVKGHVEQGETEEQTLFRELKEETTLTHAELAQGFKQHTSYFFRREGATIFKEVIFYLLESKQGTVSISHEHQAFEWIPFEAALKRLSFKNTKVVLEKAGEFLAQKH